MSKSTTRHACSDFVSGFVREVVRYRNHYVSRFAAMHFERQITSDPDCMIEVGCLPAVNAAATGVDVLNDEQAQLVLWGEHHLHDFGTTVF